MSNDDLQSEWDDKSKDVITVSWSIEDVKEIRLDLNDDQAREVLHLADQPYDASVGINWDFLKLHAHDLYLVLGDVEGTCKILSLCGQLRAH